MNRRNAFHNKPQRQFELTWEDLSENA